MCVGERESVCVSEREVNGGKRESVCERVCVRECVCGER